MLSAGRPRVRKDAGLHLRGRRPAPTLSCAAIALEPRLLFDGAAAVAVDAAPAGDGGFGFAAPVHGAAPAANDVAVTGGAPHAAVPPDGAAALPAFLATAAANEPAVAIEVGKGAFADCAALEAAVAAGHDAIAAADVDGADAADVVHFAISVRNEGRGDAFDLRVADRLPDGFTPADVGNLRLLDAEGRPVDFRAGGVLRDPLGGADIRSEAAFAAALFSDRGVELVDPGAGEGFLASRHDPCRPAQLVIAYEARLPQSVVAGATLHNEASVVQAADRECGPNRVDPCAAPSDCASITVDGARLATRLIATDQVHTRGNDVVVGEILTYETVITLPEGRSPDAVLTHRLDPGLSLVCVESIRFGEGVEATAAPRADAILPQDADGGEANRFVIDFGEIRNRNADNRVPDTVTVVFRAVASNVWSNQEGASLGMAADYRSGDGRHVNQRGDGGVGGDGRGGERSARAVTQDAVAPLVDLQAEAESATLVEPVLEVTVTPDGDAVRAGDTAAFVVTVRNRGEVDAFDVTFDGIAASPGLAIAPGGWQPPGHDGTIAVLRSGEATSFTVQAVVAADARPGEALGIDVSVRYTSLPDGAADCGCGPDGGPGDRSPFVDGSDRERTGEDGPGGLDDYVAADGGRVIPFVPCPPEPPACAPQPPACVPPPACAPEPPACAPEPPACAPEPPACAPEPPPDCAPPPEPPVCESPPSQPPAPPPGEPPPPAGPPPAEPPPPATEPPPPAGPPPSEPPVAPPPSEPPTSGPPPAGPPPSGPPPGGPPPAGPPPAGPPPAGPPPVDPPVSGPPPGAIPPPAGPPPTSPPAGPPTPPPAAPPGGPSTGPGLTMDERRPLPRPGALLDALPPAAMLEPLGLADPFARDPLRPIDVRLPEAGAGGRGIPAQAETPVGKDDECVPAKPVAEKPRPAVKRSVFADGAAARPKRPPFSEQVEAAKKRVAPPVVVKARPAPEC